MPNGSQCCALEICCPPAQRKERVAAAIAKFTGESQSCCLKFLDWLEHEGLVVAPESFQQVINDIATIARRHGAA